jgi:hypothetical protein
MLPEAFLSPDIQNLIRRKAGKVGAQIVNV